MRPYNKRYVPRSLQKLLESPEAYMIMRDISPFSLFQVGKIWTKYHSLAQNIPNAVNLKEYSPHFRNMLIVGDTHGDFESILKITRPFFEKKVDGLVFMGDFVDRGEFGFLSLMYLIAMSLAWPDRVILLRGNHEDMSLNLIFGFYQELQRYFQNADIFEAICATVEGLYDLMSLAAITPLDSLCIHAGIPKEPFKLDFLNQIPKPHSNFNFIENSKLKNQMHNVFTQIRWNDPSENPYVHPEERSYHGFFYYTEPVVDRFLSENNLKRIYRSHEHPRGSFQEIFPKKLYHVFSSSPNACIIHEKDGAIYMRDLDFKILKKIKKKDPQ
ncbi:MAG: metallophosphoesterase family protein [Promethearchaeota archaeon]